MTARQLRKEEISPDDLRRWVREVVERQLELGLSIINDGELGRADYVSATVRRISGFDGTCFAPIPRDLEEMPELSRRFTGRNGLIALNPKAPISLPACSAELAYAGEESLRSELDLLRGAFHECPTAGSELFFTAPSPGTLALFLENQHYPDYRRYVEKLGQLLRREYELIQSYGMFLQVDCPDLAMGRHTVHKGLSDADFLRIVETNVGVLNDALGNVDPARSRAHICWGNYPGTHHYDVELRTIFESVMRLRPRFISLESSNHRHAHEWEVFRDLRFPADKVLLPGVIDTRSNTMEHPDLIAQRLLAFAAILGAERVMGSTDCGFASTAAASAVSGEVAWLKLGALTEGARRASRRL